MHKTRTAIFLLAGLLVGGSAVILLPPVHAQSKAFPDTPDNHWAYNAVRSLADKGLVKGYPDGKFLGRRTLTRYEFASVIDRLIQTLADMKTGAVPSPPASVTQDDLNKIQVLAETFGKELAAQETDLAAAKADIAALRKSVGEAKAAADKAQTTADNSYGFGANRKFQIGGFVMTRFEAGDSGSKTRFPQGSPAVNGPYNGNYAQGGNSETFKIREARLFVTGAVTPTSRYLVEFGLPGAVSASGPGASQIFVRRAYGQYTIPDGVAKNLTVTAGQFWNPFGFMINSPRPTWYSAERPLAFNETANGLFSNQEFDRGVKATYPTGPLLLTAALINGTGVTQNDVDRRIDQVYRVAYQSKNKQIGLGASYYTGQLPGTGVGTGSPGNPTATPPVPPTPAYSAGKKELYGMDAQFVSPSGPFVLAEYLAGKYEQRNAFATDAATAITALNPAPGNKVEGYYVQTGYTFGPAKNHPLTLVLGYDVFRRSKSGRSDSGSSYDDKNFGYGILYGLDKQTRLRFWYEKPREVAHTPSSPAPPKIGLFSGELLVRF